MAAGKAGEKPWIALGLSKSTYYRREKAKGEGVAPKGRRGSETQDAVNRALAKQARVSLETALDGKEDDDGVAFTGTADLIRAVIEVLRKSGC